MIKINKTNSKFASFSCKEFYKKYYFQSNFHLMILLNVNSIWLNRELNLGW